MALRLDAIAICIVFMFIGPGLILLNQYILKELDFPFPMFLSGLGVTASALTANVLVKTGFVTLQKKEAVEGTLWFKRVLPVGLAHAGTLAFGNTVYLFLNVGFIQMLKSFTPVIIMFTGYFVRVENPSTSTMVSVAIITVGTIATCSFNPQLNILGLIVMFLAEFAEAIRLIFTQFFLQQLKFGVVEGMYVLAPASAFWLMMASFIFEFQDMYQKGALQIIIDNFPAFFIASFMGIGVNFLAYLVIQYTSSLTMKILGTLRNILTIIFGVMFYNEIITFHEGCGYFVALVGFALYNMSQSGTLDQYLQHWGLISSVRPIVATKIANDSSDNKGDIEAK